MIPALLADDMSWFTELTKGATGIALGMIIASSGWGWLIVKFILPRIDKMIRAMGWLARSNSALVLGNPNYTPAAQSEARTVIGEIDASEGRTTNQQ